MITVAKQIFEEKMWFWEENFPSVYKKIIEILNMHNNSSKS